MWTLAIQGLGLGSGLKIGYPIFLHPESPQGAPLGVATVTDSLIASTFFVTDTAGDIICPQVYQYLPKPAFSFIDFSFVQFH